MVGQTDNASVLDSFTTSIAHVGATWMDSNVTTAEAISTVLSSLNSSLTVSNWRNTTIALSATTPSASSSTVSGVIAGPNHSVLRSPPLLTTTLAAIVTTGAGHVSRVTNTAAAIATTSTWLTTTTTTTTGVNSAAVVIVAPDGSQACELLGKFGSLGWWLQLFLGVFCLASLIGKRFTDRIRRPWKVWFFDTSKQGLQAFLNHFLNILISVAYGEFMDNDADPCNWYWINLSLDCTLGVLILYIMLAVLKWVYRLECVGRPELAMSGDYGDPPSWAIFRRQLWDWQCLALIQKFLLATLVIRCRHLMAAIAEFLLGWLHDRPQGKLVVVMVLSPLLLNVFAMWVADSFLQAPGADTLEALSKQRVSTEPRGPAATTLGAVDDDFRHDPLVSFSEWKRRQIKKLRHDRWQQL